MSQPKIKLAIVDDHKLFRDGLVSLLSAFEEFSINIVASNGLIFFEELLKKKRTIDVLLLDAEMPEMNGIEVLKKLKLTNSEIKPLVLTMHNEDEIIFEFVELGARGLLHKSADIEEVVDAIHSLYINELYFNEEISQRVIKKLVKKQHIKKLNINTSLSNREKEIIKLICNQSTTKEIADKLFISERTVESHKKNIFEKTNSKNSAGVVLFAVRSGLVE
ncbi:MAG: response regulator transcription factor [Bacteroidota bacterium]|nr:response regulator transcription factor [Bacteroidota bacterium]